MVYNFNLGIGWASSGVEYAQSYRANLLRRAHIPARLIFTDMFPTENIEHMTRNIGFLDEEVIWLYTFFTDVKTSPVTFTLKELEAAMAEEDYAFFSTPSSLPTFMKAAMHLSSCSRVCAADSCTRILACSLGTTG